jgi:peptidoglycan/LPS O-acetylase OafA/YrhL
MTRYLGLVEPRGAVPALDGVRGIAILMVVLFHAAEPFRTAGTPLLPLLGLDLSAPLQVGWAGVNLFFVLSGFLITRQLIRHSYDLGSMRGIGRYLAKRWLRIVPLYLTVLFLAVFELTPGHFVSGENLWLRVGYHLLFLQDYLPSNIVGPFWSLGVEEKFYLLMPVVFLALLALKTRRRQLALLIALACLPLLIRILMQLRVQGPITLADFILQWRNPFHLNLDALFTGVLAAVLVHWRKDLPMLQTAGLAWRLRMVGAGLLVVLLGFVMTLDHVPWMQTVLLQPLLALGMGTWVLGVALEDAGRQLILESRWMARAGRLAYAWYLSHILVLAWLLDGLGFQPDHSGSAFLNLLPKFAGLSILSALALHFTVEKPFLLLKARIGAPRLQSPRLYHGVTAT